MFLLYLYWLSSYKWRATRMKFGIHIEHHSKGLQKFLASWLNIYASYWISCISRIEGNSLLRPSTNTLSLHIIQNMYETYFRIQLIIFIWYIWIRYTSMFIYIKWILWIYIIGWIKLSNVYSTLSLISRYILCEVYFKLIHLNKIRINVSTTLLGLVMLFWHFKNVSFFRHKHLSHIFFTRCESSKIVKFFTSTQIFHKINIV